MTDQHFIRRGTVPPGHALTTRAKTVRYIGGEYVEAPFDPADKTQQVYRPSERPPFTWEAGA